ncbi:MAG: hypothetical protein QOD72_2305 [Acidimicrobiaceae bacterium]|nr:hypothetical protein [Acidimicrobiaceae bacterium]
MDSLNRRTEGDGGVDLDPAAHVLAVGARTATLDNMFDRSQVLHTYLELVSEQRSGPLAVRADLRERDLVSLAAILDLPAAQLERYIDRELARFLASNALNAAALTPSVSTVRRRRLRFVLFVLAVIAVGAAAGAIVTLAVRPTPAPAVPAAAVSP